MKKSFSIILGVFAGLLLTVTSITSFNSEHEIYTSSKNNLYSSSNNVNTSEKLLSDSSSALSSNNNVQASAFGSESASSSNVQILNPEFNANLTLATKDTNKTLSRGGQPPKESAVQKQESQEKKEQKELEKPKKPKTEGLDWWEDARYVFSKDAIAEIKDLYTGKTFKVKRTGGSNHADCEALTLEDTKIIKSIWGGFSWERRPVHVYIDGRVIAASMSAMPHAGLDSAPAHEYVSNRSGGYGRGENLDSVKKNGMDGHFDIHFLNSTRHKDGRKDPDHQAMIKISVKK
jgi:hypothetical protein